MPPSAPGPRLQRSAAEPVIACLQVAALYVLAGALALALFRTSDWSCPLWPPAGLAVGVLLTAEPGRRQGIGLGSFLLNLVNLQLKGLSGPGMVMVSAGLGLAALLQAEVGAHLLRRRLGPRPPLEGGREILSFMALAGPAACLTGSTLGVLILWRAGLLMSDEVARAWLTSWVGDITGVVVFTPLTLMALPSLQNHWQGRRQIVAVPSLLVLAIAVEARLYAGSIERNSFLLRLERRADLAVASLGRNLTAHQEALYGVQSLIRATGTPSPEEFSRFTSSSLQRLEGLHAISWNPVVTAAERLDFEARQRQLPGREAFRILERNRAGALGPARQDRLITVPVTLIEPLPANRSSLGFDIASNPVVNEAIRAARALGRMQATAPIRLVQEQGAQKEILLLLLPIDEPRGFVVGVYRLGDLLVSSFNDPGWQDFRIRLLESTNEGEPRELARFASNPTVIRRSGRGIPPALRKPIELAGRQFLIELTPTQPLAEGLMGSSSLLFTLGTLLVCAPLEGFLLLSSGTERLRRRNLQRKLRTSLMAAAKAHEIKQPLARLLLQAGSIHTRQQAAHRANGAAAADLSTLAEGIVRDAREVSHAIDGIRNLLGEIQGPLTAMDLNHPVQDSRLMLNIELENQQIQLDVDGLEEPHLIEGDRGQLQIMLVNLLRNAMAATGPGGHITVTLQQKRFGVELAIEDDGPGFPEGLARIEDLFLTSRSRGGTGIGLFLVSCAVENHRGMIQLGRSPLGGADVRIWLPSLSRRPCEVRRS